MGQQKRKVGRPTEKAGIDTEQVLAECLKQFAQLGYGGVTIKLLAKQTGVADSLLYYHFGPKEKIWQKATLRAGKTISDSLTDVFTVLDGTSGLERITIYIKKIVLFSSEHPEFQQVVVQEMFSQSSRSDFLIDEVLKPIFSYLEEAIKEEQRKGTVKAIPPANLFSFIIGSITTFFARSYQMQKLYGVNSFDQDQIKQHIQLISDLILGGLLTDSEASGKAITSG
jgi:AcrR family transcriptional regulator